MTHDPRQHRTDDDLTAIARRVMAENGFASDFSKEALDQAARAASEAPASDGVADLRALLWSSIDNRESRDLDQIEVAEELPGGRVRVRIGIADVDALVPRGSPIDARAAVNTTSVYTGVAIFPMLPEALSNDATSLLGARDRLAVVIDLEVDEAGKVSGEAVTRAWVRNHAKLAYDDLGAWLESKEGEGRAPESVASVPGLAEQLRLQDSVARKLREVRVAQGALELGTIEARPVAKGGEVVALEVTEKNRARDLIEDLMITANGVSARVLEAAKLPGLRRVVRTPRRWDRIVELAKGYGEALPEAPDPRALAAFLAARKAADPDHFPDLSLSIVKLLGPGEYTVSLPGVAHEGHFGLAVDDYSHSTAPNRRFADLVTQRLLKAATRGEASPYTTEELEAIARRSTEREGAARKVERTMRKVAAARLLSSRIGDTFDGIVTGAADKGTFARLIDPPAEGRIVSGERGLDVGDRVRLRLVATDASKGFIDLARVDGSA